MSRVMDAKFSVIVDGRSSWFAYDFEELRASLRRSVDQGRQVAVFRRVDPHDLDQFMFEE